MTDRRRTLKTLAGAAGMLGFPATTRAQTAVPTATLSVDMGRKLRAVNPMILGNNLDWTYNAQGMYEDGTQQTKPGFMALADRLAPTALRFPGGTNADFYRWKDGIGPVARRGKGRNLGGNMEQHLLGTDEFLALCKRWNAEPLITVNIATAPAQEAAEWVQYCNQRAAAGMPKVRYWEIGNEPYLEEAIPEAKMSPAEYARRVNAFIKAMKTVDPGIQCGITLRTDTIGGVEGTPFKGFNDTVLGIVDQPYEFVALHSSYYPVVPKKEESTDAMFLATMAGTRAMEADVQATRAALLRRHGPNRIKLAFTEVNALYSVDILRFGMAAIFLSKTDRYIESMAAALYVADALRSFTTMDDLLMANYWSLNGNWWFGAISHETKPRPQFHVLEAYRQLNRGDLLDCRVGSPTFPTARAGFVPAYPDTPQVAAHAVSQDGVVRLAAINRHPRSGARLMLDVPGHPRATVKVHELNSNGPFDRDVRWSDHSVALINGQAEISMRPHAFAVLSLQPD